MFREIPHCVPCRDGEHPSLPRAKQCSLFFDLESKSLEVQPSLHWTTENTSSWLPWTMAGLNSRFKTKSTAQINVLDALASKAEIFPSNLLLAVKARGQQQNGRRTDEVSIRF